MTWLVLGLGAAAGLELWLLLRCHAARARLAAHTELLEAEIEKLRRNAAIDAAPMDAAAADDAARDLAGRLPKTD